MDTRINRLERYSHNRYIRHIGLKETVNAYRSTEPERDRSREELRQVGLAIGAIRAIPRPQYMTSWTAKY